MTSTSKAPEEIVTTSAPSEASDFNTKIMVAEYPAVGEYQTRTTRQIPVFMLTRPD